MDTLGPTTYSMIQLTFHTGIMKNNKDELWWVDNNDTLQTEPDNGLTHDEMVGSPLSGRWQGRYDSGKDVVTIGWSDTSTDEEYIRQLLKLQYPTARIVTVRGYKSMKAKSINKDLISYDDIGYSPSEGTSKPAQYISSNDDEWSVIYRLTDNSLDRDNETVNPRGCDLSQFSQNSAIIFNHDTDSFPLGMMHPLDPNYSGPPEIWFDEAEEALFGKVYFSKVNPTSRQAYEQIKEGSLKGGSVSFLPKGNPSKNASGGNRYDEWTLLEFSICPIGSNPNALVVGNSLSKKLKKKAMVCKDGVCTVYDDPVLFKAYKKTLETKAISDSGWQSYYNYGHGENAGDTAWWLKENGDIETRSCSRTGMNESHSPEETEDWHGRYDGEKDAVSLVGGEHNSEYDREYVERLLKMEFPTARIVYIKSKTLKGKGCSCNKTCGKCGIKNKSTCYSRIMNTSYQSRS